MAKGKHIHFRTEDSIHELATKMANARNIPISKYIEMLIERDANPNICPMCKQEIKTKSEKK